MRSAVTAAMGTIRGIQSPDQREGWVRRRALYIYIRGIHSCAPDQREGQSRTAATAVKGTILV